MDADSDAHNGRISRNGHASGPRRGVAVVPLGASCKTARRVIHECNDDIDNVHSGLVSYTYFTVYSDHLYQKFQLPSYIMNGGTCVTGR